MTLDQNLNNKKTHKCFKWPIKIWKNVLKIWLQSVGVEQQQLQEQSQMLVSWKYKKIFAIRPNGMYDDMYLRIWISRSGAHRKSCMGPV